jgi:hypothetical protein
VFSELGAFDKEWQAIQSVDYCVVPMLLKMDHPVKPCIWSFKSTEIVDEEANTVTCKHNRRACLRKRPIRRNLHP